MTLKQLMAIITIGACFLASNALSQTTQPASDSRLEYRAGRAFERGEYAKALPLLRELVGQLMDRPAKAAVTLDRIKLCEKELAKLTPAASPFDP
ncbi:MAG TPA: hypothetical protein VGF52_05320 [Tepidisphaeraceae bacterium]|jgi:hypothetical protein